MGYNHSSCRREYYYSYYSFIMHGGLSKLFSVFEEKVKISSSHPNFFVDGFLSSCCFTWKQLNVKYITITIFSLSIIPGGQQHNIPTVIFLLPPYSYDSIEIAVDTIKAKNYNNNVK